MCSLPVSRQDLYIVGIGHPLRGDDRVGICLVERLQRHFSGGFNGEVAYEMDLALAEVFSRYNELLIVDAASPGSIASPFVTVPIDAGVSNQFPGGFLTHIFDWSFLLGLARDMYGHAPEAKVVAVAAEDCSLGETLTDECAANADQAFAYLLECCENKVGE